MSDLHFSDFEAFSDYDFQKLSQSQSESTGGESEEESSSFSESQVGCYFCVQYSHFCKQQSVFFFSTNYDGNITDEQLRTRNVHNHLLALVLFFLFFFIATEND